MLVRTGADSGGKEQWLMLHKHDDFAVPGWDPEEHPRSVLSGRTNDEVLADPDRLWRSDLPAGEASIALKDPTRRAQPDPDELAALDELPAVRAVAGLRPRAQGDQPRQGAVPGLGRRTSRSPSGSSCATPRRSRRSTLPYLAGRALNMHRFPQGAASKGFWHKELPGTARRTG